MTKTLLLNYVTWQNVGHLIEVLRYAQGYRVANPDLEISIVVNRHTPHVLATLLPWIRNVYTVDIPHISSPVDSSLYSHIPRTWDYIARDPNEVCSEGCAGAFRQYAEQSRSYFIARDGSGYCGANFLAYSPMQPLRFDLLQSSSAAPPSQELVKIGVLFAGMNHRAFYPSLASWKLMLDAIREQYPGVQFHFFGRFHRTDSSTVSSLLPSELMEMLALFPNSRNCFDLPIIDQLAILKDLHLFFSPHSGFAFAALCMGTPWLTLSGGRWKEYFFNSVPFYSVLPDPRRYPSYEQLESGPVVEDGGPRIIGMSRQRVLEDLPEILRGADLLVSQKLDYQQCLTLHFEKLLQFYGGSMEQMLNCPEFRLYYDTRYLLDPAFRGLSSGSGQPDMVGLHR